ncbi:hypothetical protein ACLKA6_001085 [Drosophila palustris]
MFESKTPIIAVNNHRDQFMGLTHDDLRRCLALPNEEYICFDHQGVFNVNNRSAYAALVVSVILLCAYALQKQRLWTLRPTATRNETANPSAPSASPRRFTLDLEEG